MSADSINTDNPDEQAEKELCYPQELLNRLSAGAAMPDHNLLLKKGFIVMLLRNMYPQDGHANGTRYVVTGMTNNVLFLKIASGQYKGQVLTLPRVKCSPGDDTFPINGFTRLQFPVRVCFAMTVNKAQGQSISGKLGLDLRFECFSHGQLYVALSRATHPKNIFVRTSKGIHQTKNVVYPEVLGDVSRMEQDKISSTCTTKKPKVFSGKRPFSGQKERIRKQVKRRKTVFSPSEGLESQYRKKRSEEDSSHDDLIMIEDNPPDAETNTVMFPLSTWNFGGITVHMSDMTYVLDNDAYISDAPILGALNLIRSTDILILDTFFTTFLQRDGSANALAPSAGELENCQIAMLPLHTRDPDHWGLALFDKINSQIHLYDSLSTPDFWKQLSMLQIWASEISNELGLQSWRNAWTLNPNRRNSSRQIDGVSCGIYAIINGLCIAKGNRNPFIRPEDIPMYREKLSICIGSNSLDPLLEVLS